MEPREIISRLDELSARCDVSLESLSDEHEIRALQASFLSGKGEISVLQKLIKEVPPKNRREVGQAFITLTDFSNLENLAMSDKDKMFKVEKGVVSYAQRS